MIFESRKCINVRKIVEYLVSDIATKLPQIHAVTGCDTTSFLHTVAKIKAPKSAYSRVPNNRHPPLLIFRFFSTQDIFIPTSPIINFQPFLLTFLSVNSHFNHSPL